MNYLEYKMRAYLGNLLASTYLEEISFFPFQPLLYEDEKRLMLEAKSMVGHTDRKFFQKLFLETPMPKECHCSRGIKSLVSTFNLDENEFKIFELVLTFTRGGMIRDFVKNVTGSSYFDNFLLDSGHMLLKTSKEEVATTLGPQSRLIRSGLLIKNSYGDYKVPDYVNSFVLTFKGQSFLEALLKVDEMEVSLKMESYWASQKIALMARILQNKSAAKILLTGVPGTGKTTTARILRDLTGFKLMFINSAEKGAESVNQRRSLMTSLNMIGAENCIYVIDEAEIIVNANEFALNPSSCNKSWMNHYLDINKTRQIYIVNEPGRISESTIRRFDYVLSFKELSRGERKDVIKTVAATEDLALNDEEINAMANFEVSPAEFEQSLKLSLRLSKDKQSIFRDWCAILESKRSHKGGFSKGRISINGNEDV